MLRFVCAILYNAFLPHKDARLVLKHTHVAAPEMLEVISLILWVGL